MSEDDNIIRDFVIDKYLKSYVISIMKLEHIGKLEPRRTST